VKTIIGPFKTKCVEPIQFNIEAERKIDLENAWYNPFLLHANDVMIDLLTDSGKSALSSAQWAGIMLGDESYAGSPSFYKFEKTVQDLTGMPIVIPTHQGRASEKILFSVSGGKDKVFLSNTLFDTTRANIKFSGSTGIDLICEEGRHPSIPAPFRGNIDTGALEKYIQKTTLTILPW
jgi:tryptophanase